MRLITGGQHLITLQRFPLHRTALMAVELAGELLLHSTRRIWPWDGNSQHATLNQQSNPLSFNNWHVWDCPFLGSVFIQDSLQYESQNMAFKLQTELLTYLTADTLVHSRHVSLASSVREKEARERPGCFTSSPGSRMGLSAQLSQGRQLMAPGCS